jgi:predicted nucleic-acid-binding Zn-ribbon protein
LSANQCPKCASPMEEGYMLDLGHLNVGNRLRWVSGLPETGFWGVLKVRGRKQKATLALRCVRCGFLEIFAPEVGDDPAHAPDWRVPGPGD